MAKRKRRNKLTLSVAITLVSLGAIAALSLPIDTLRDFEWRVDSLFFDLFSRANLQSTYDPTSSVIVAFDGPSLQQAGYPLSRSFYASALKRLAPAKGIAIDVIFGESKDVNATYDLAEAIKQSPPVILSATQTDDGQLDGPVGELSSATTVAVSDSVLDSDGKLRWYPLVHREGSTWHPSPALAAWTLQSGGKWSVGERDHRVSALHLKSSAREQTIDLSSDPNGLGRMLLRIPARSSSITGLSLYDLTQNTFLPPEALRDKIVFIGASVDGLRMHQPTPVDENQVPLHVHALAFEALANNSVTERSLIGAQINALIGLGLLLLCALLSPLRLTTKLIGAIAAVSVLDIYACDLAFAHGPFVSPAPMLFFVTVALTTFALRLLARSRNSRAQLQKAFGRYLHPELVARIADPDQSIDVAGETRELAILFMDLRGFTTLSENLKPHQLIDVMNRYLGSASDAIQKHEGTVDKFIGDAVMAFWNAPVKIEKPAAQCLAAVLEIQTQIAELNRYCIETLKLQTTLSLGAGLHWGETIVGNIGGAGRFNYTAMGDNVNVTSRVEGLCKLYGFSILMTEDFVRAAGSLEDVIEIDHVKLKGRSSSTRIFAYVDWNETQRREWAHSLSAYYAGRFQDVRINQSLVLADLFTKRILQIKTPPSSWDGVWKLESK